jgi:hypothetical protein
VRLGIRFVTGWSLHPYSLATDDMLPRGILLDIEFCLRKLFDYPNRSSDEVRESLSLDRKMKFRITLYARSTDRS